MNKVLGLKEAEEIANKMLKSSGFNKVKAVYDKYDSSHCCSLHHFEEVKKKIGFLWWRKEISVEELLPACFSAATFEAVLVKVENWLNSSQVKERIDLANKFKEKHAKQLIDEELDAVLSD